MKIFRFTGQIGHESTQVFTLCLHPPQTLTDKPMNATACVALFIRLRKVTQAVAF